MKDEIQLNFKDVNQQILTFCAFRYALGARSYVARAIYDIICANWKNMDPITRSKYKTEIREAINEDRAGSKYEIDDWSRILTLED